MTGILRFILLISIIFSGFEASCQEKITPEAYEFPKNTIKASRTFAVFSLHPQSFTAQSMVDRYSFQNSQLTCHIREDKSANRFIEEKFSYEKGQLSSKEIIRTSSAGTEYTRFIFRTTSYNDNGHAIETLEYYPAKENEDKQLYKTHYPAYLYEQDVWIAKIEYSSHVRDPVKLVVAIRSLEIGDKIYQPQNDEQLISFCKQVYQLYLTKIKN